MNKLEKNKIPVTIRKSRGKDIDAVLTLYLNSCYPRRTFYPLSDGPSTQNHRITMTDFRLCLTCLSLSQAGFCHYTLQAISIRLEPTFASLRYSLGGDRPSQTTHQTLS